MVQLFSAKVKKCLDLGHREMKTLLNILREGNVKVERNLMGVLEEIGRTLEDEYQDVKMNLEKSAIAEEDVEKIEKGGRKKNFG